ncbi:MAG: Sir2 family NAD-dependent protein deacetylase [Verrucomicrobiota bacterium]
MKRLRKTAANFNAAFTDQLAGMLSESNRIVFLTGAGMSTKSGIPDFRSSSGLYRTGVSANIFDIKAFRDNPADFYAFARNFLAMLNNARPNAAHSAIAQLGSRPDKNVSVVTQNIDTLHQRSGSTEVFPVHGTVETSSCIACGKKVKTETLYPLIEAGKVPRHENCGGVFKPDIIFFGELLPTDVFACAQKAITEADLLVVAGTSLHVYPAADLPNHRRSDCRLVIINHTPTPLDHESDILFHCGVEEVLALAVEKAFQST